MRRALKLINLSALSALSALSLSALGALSPAPALACGGFFCNADVPVSQSAERIVFARAGGQVHMHVQINYEGPPTEFGWLLPAPPDVVTEISSAALFGALDRLYGPRFNLNYTYDDGCAPQFDYDTNALPAPLPRAEGGEGGVQVLSREAIGPYDRALLLPDSVQALRDWLDLNGFQIPTDIDAKLQPYVELRLAFVAIKLLPGSDSGDIVPLSLKFAGDRPSIPLIPTAVAATPDMGVIVHVLDQRRAVPVNYRHVRINEAAIDWVGGGANYASVVSAAVDQAGGRAFTTDYAGPVGEQLGSVLTPCGEDVLAAVGASTSLFELMSHFSDRTNPDLHRVMANVAQVPADLDPAIFFRCVECYSQADQEVDGAAVAEALRREINEVYAQINALIAAAPYMTRLYSTLSADEMTADPIFSVNPDLEDVSNVHTAEARVSCDAQGNTTSTRLTLADGRTLLIEELTPVVRQGGETVRGADVPAAATVEQMFEAGQPEVQTELPMGGAEGMSPSTTSDAKDSGCQQRGGRPALPFALLALLALLGGAPLLRRRAAR